MAPRPIPSFYKILLDPSAPHLPLPTGFVRKHLENKIPENPILRSVNGGYSWRLTIKKVGENYCFVNGWNDVVEDSQLGFGDFLVFWLVDPSTFKLSIFSPSGCEKDFPVEYNDVNEEEGENEEVDEEDEEEGESESEEDDVEELDEDEYEDEEEEFEEEEEEEEDDDIYDDGGRGGVGNEEEDDGDEDDDDGCDVDGNDGDPFFMTIISKGHTRSMRLPSEFARLAGIDAERSVTMKNLDGDEWEMSLISEQKYNAESSNSTRYYLSSGWIEFWRVNELSEGDECVFKYIKSEDKLCLARVTKKRVSAKQPAGKAPATEVLKRRQGGQPPRVEVKGKEDGREVVEKELQPKQPAGTAPMAEVSKRSRGQPPEMEEVKKKGRSKQSAGKVPAAEVSKRSRGRPPRTEVVEKKVRSEKPAGKSPAAEVSKRSRGRPKRSRGRPRCVEMVEKKVRSKKPAGKAPAAEVLKRKRGRPSHVEVESKDDSAKVVKRSRGRPIKRKRGRPVADVK